ncbi:TetR/AcrR family transcriptional regulator [Eisenbergiella sp.]
MPKISEEKKKQRQRDILKTALGLFSKKGYYATSIDDITREAGISKGLVYTYFKSKEEIFFGLAEHWEELTENPSLQDALSRAITGDMSLAEKLICVWDESVKQWTEEDLVFARINFEFWLEASKNEVLREKMKEKARGSLGMVEKIIFSSRPDVDPEAAAAFSRLWWSQIDGLAAYFISYHILPPEREMARIRDIILHMCRYFDE